MPFPSTPILDPLTATEDPISDGATWSSTGAASTQLQATATVTAGAFGRGVTECTSYRSDIGVVGDSECYMTISALPGGGLITGPFIRANNNPIPTQSGYVLYLQGSDLTTMSLHRITNNSDTQLGATITQGWDVGDGVGLRAIGSTIEVWFRDELAGAWVQVATRSDATYATGRIGLYSYGGNVRITDFGGGTYTAPLRRPGHIYISDPGIQQAGPVSSGSAGPISGPVMIGVNPGSDTAGALSTYLPNIDFSNARMEWEIGTSPATMEPTIDAYNAAGITPLLVAGFYGRIPSQAEAESLVNWASAFEGQVSAIEFGNETSYSYQGTHLQGGAYATRARQAAISMQSYSVPLLVQAENASGNWLGDMFASVSDLDVYADGWTLHPYSSAIYDSRTADLEVFLSTKASRNIWITECGMASDNGVSLSSNQGWPVNQTYAQAATNMRTIFNTIKPRIHAWFFYHLHDLSAPGANVDPENYYGTLKNNASDKGAYSTEVRSIIAENL